MTGTTQARLAALDSTAVSDALDRAGRRGVALGLAALSGDRKIVGRAVTVQLGPDDGRVSGRHLCTAAVEASGPQDVIVIANGGRTDVAGWGGLLTVAAHVRGTGGVIIDGVCRDLDEIRDVGLAVYGRGAVPVTARGRVTELAWNVPVQLCGVEVRPGDYVIADGSGVAVVPADAAEDLIEAAENIADRERRMAEAIRQGEPVSQVMGSSYEELARRNRT